MTNRIQWGHASIALYTLHTPERAAEELLPQERPDGPFALGLACLPLSGLRTK